LKYGHDDLRDVLERASARETAARVAAGALARQILRDVSVVVTSHVFSIGHVSVADPHGVPFEAAAALPDDSPTRCPDGDAAARMIAAIEEAKAAGDTLGGAFEVIVRGLPAGLGSYTQWDRRLDGRLAQALMSIPAIKAVGFGMADDVARRPGSQVHDAILPKATDARSPAATPVLRPTNHAGGLEGGVTNGEDLRVSASMKPIATLMRPLPSVDLRTLTPADAAIERSDVCAVPAAAVVGEAMVALVLADALLERFGADRMDDLRARVTADAARVAARLAGTGGVSA
jgi:chorismate synthase